MFFLPMEVSTVQYDDVRAHFSKDSVIHYSACLPACPILPEFGMHRPIMKEERKRRLRGSTASPRQQRFLPSTKFIKEKRSATRKTKGLQPHLIPSGARECKSQPQALTTRATVAIGASQLPTGRGSNFRCSKKLSRMRIAMKYDSTPERFQ